MKLLINILLMGERWGVGGGGGGQSRFDRDSRIADGNGDAVFGFRVFSSLTFAVLFLAYDKAAVNTY